VITPHGEDIHSVPEIGFGQRLDPVQRAKIDYAVRAADLLTAISGSVEASLLEAGAYCERIRRIPNGVDLARFACPPIGNIFHWLNLPTNSRLIITVGNYRPIKGHDVLIRAMPSVLRERPDARLVIVGRTSDVLETMVADLGLREVVRFTGLIELPRRLTGNNGSAGEHEDRLAGLYAGSEVYVSSGIGEGAEGLSLAVLEAMAAGLPVVATNISGNKDMVQPGENGYLVPPGDADALAAAVLRVLQNRQLRGAMASNARGVAARFEWKEIALRYLDAYRESIDASESRRG
jgi:glycosyltransferase involved in cell wall biosynthesis